MKLTNFVAVTACVAAISLCAAGCATTDSAPATATTTTAKKARHVERELIDWKGAAIGQDVPLWVSYAVDSDYDSLSKIRELEGKKIFLAENTGKNLNVLKSWTNNFDINGSFGREVSNYVVSSFGGILDGSVSKADDESFLEECVGSFSKTRVSGLSKRMDYWVEQRIIDNDAKTTEDEYQYFVVYTMEQEDYRTLIDRALGTVNARTAREQELKNEVRDIALSAVMLSNIDEEESRAASEQ